MISSVNDSHVCIITLNDSKHGNTLTLVALRELIGILDAALDNDQIRIILLRADGSAFCHGMNLDEANVGSINKEVISRAADLYCELLLKIYRSRKPVVCCVNGSVKAGGIGIMSACDIILVSESSTFQLSEIFVGLIPANVIPFLYLLRLSPQNVRYLVLSGKTITSHDAYRMNLVNEVHSDATLESGVKAIIQQLLRASPSACEKVKEYTDQLQGKNLTESIGIAQSLFVDMMTSTTTRTVLDNFNNGITPDWFVKYRPGVPLICKDL